MPTLFVSLLIAGTATINGDIFFILNLNLKGFWSHFGVDSMNQEDDLELRFPFQEKDKE